MSSSAKSSRGPVWYQYFDTNRELAYYFEPRSQQTVWEPPSNVTIKDGKTNRELHEVLERGLMVQLLDKAIWENESIDDIKTIIDVLLYFLIRYIK